MSTRTAVPPSVSPKSAKGAASPTPSQKQRLAGLVAQAAIQQATSPRAVKPPVEGVQNAHADFITWSYQPHGALFDENVAKVEASTGLKREQIAYALAALMAVYLILGSAAQILCNLIGFAYPAYVSVKAIRTEGKDDDTQWLIYWTVFASFSLIDFFSGWVMSWFPFYWLAKAIFLVYLYLPQTMGAQTLYVGYVDPFVTKVDKFVDAKWEASMDCIDHLKPKEQ